MIGYLAVIFLCQLIGEIFTKVANLPVPGPVIGMVILFCGLILARRLPPELETAGGFLLRYLPLLFVPAGVGVITNLDLLKRNWSPIAGAVIVGTIVTIAATGAVMMALNRRAAHRREDRR